MKTYWGSKVTASYILNLGTRWRWMVSFMYQLFYTQGKSSWYPLDSRLSGPQSILEAVKRKIPSVCWELNPRTLTVQPLQLSWDISSSLWHSELFLDQQLLYLKSSWITREIGDDILAHMHNFNLISLEAKYSYWYKPSSSMHDTSINDTCNLVITLYQFTSLQVDICTD